MKLAKTTASGILSPSKQLLLERRLRGDLEPDNFEDEPISPISRSEHIPLSFAQERLWFLDQLVKNNSFYNIPLAARLEGALDLGALERAVNELVRRHEALRTRFVEVDGEPEQEILPELKLKLQVEDLSRQREGEDREAEVRRFINEEAVGVFNLAQGPLLRLKVLRLGERKHVLLVTMHHIVSDGWSMEVLMRELTAIYKAFSEGQESPLADLSIQYGDFAVWQRNWLRGEVLEEQLGYWRGRLQDAPVLELPTDRPRPAMLSYEGGLVSMALSEALSMELEGGRADRKA